MFRSIKIGSSLSFPAGIPLGLILAVILVLCPAESPAFRYEIVWPGSGQNYNFGLPPGQADVYWTQGNNMQVVLHPSGQHIVWVQQQSLLWPRGSGERYMRYPGLWYGGVGPFSPDTKLDTTIRRHSDSGHNPGRLPHNFWWRETQSFYDAQLDLDGDRKADLPIGLLQLKVSTRESNGSHDLEKWPPEFRTDVDGDGVGDVNGDPIVISDEDVICIHHARWGMRGDFEDLDEAEGFTGYGPAIPLQFEERMMSFGHPAAQDIHFHLVTVRNASRWHFYAKNEDPSLGPVTTSEPYIDTPFDISHLMIGMYGNSGMGDGPNYVGFVPSLRLFFNFDRDFLAPNYRGQVGFSGMVFLHTPELDGEEIPLTVAGTNEAGGALRPWRLWGDREVNTNVAWNMVRGRLNLDRQSPGPNPGGVADPRQDDNVYISSWSDGIMQGMAQHDDLTLKADSTVQFDFAWVCAYPVSNPVPDQSDAGIAREAAKLIAATRMAYQLYETGYRPARGRPYPGLPQV